jgi:hypothetical protein
VLVNVIGTKVIGTIVVGTIGAKGIGTIGIVVGRLGDVCTTEKVVQTAPMVTAAPSSDRHFKRLRGAHGVIVVYSKAANGLQP